MRKIDLCAMTFALTIPAVSFADQAGLRKQVNEVCQNANQRMNASQLLTLLQAAQGKAGECQIYSTKLFPSAAAAETTTLDGYNGPVLLTRLVRDAGPAENLAATSIRLRDQDYCVQQNVGTVTIAYKLRSSQPEPYDSTVKNVIYGFFRGLPSYNDIEAVFQFSNDGRLIYVNSAFQETDIGAGMTVRQAYSGFECGAFIGSNFQ